MSILRVEVGEYRSIRSLTVPLRRINVLVGANGCGKTNLYRAMYLLHRAARGEVARTLAAEGGMPSLLWAGSRQEGKPVRMRLGVRLERMSYELECGLPADGGVTQVGQTCFFLDPRVKTERVWVHEGGRKIDFLGREDMTVLARDDEGKRVTYPMAISPGESVLAELREPHRFPELSMLRQEMVGWRFYHHFRTDAESPIRQPQVGVQTPVLGHDGVDLAAALRTIMEVGDLRGLETAVVGAFPGAELRIVSDGRMAVELRMPGFKRFFAAPELSDGTIQYLCLLGALLSPRPPGLLALNEPETSIHPDLIPALGKLIVEAGERSQLWITTHSVGLAEEIRRLSGVEPIRLEKVEGETRVVGQKVGDLGSEEIYGRMI